MPVAVTIAIGVNADRRREVQGMAVGSSEAEPFWPDFPTGGEKVLHFPYVVGARRV